VYDNSGRQSRAEPPPWQIEDEADDSELPDVPTLSPTLMLNILLLLKTLILEVTLQTSKSPFPLLLRPEVASSKCKSTGIVDSISEIVRDRHR
jgi:hypothetical protein